MAASTDDPETAAAVDAGATPEAARTTARERMVASRRTRGREIGRGADMGAEDSARAAAVEPGG
jgi:hypothetical protein